MAWLIDVEAKKEPLFVSDANATIRLDQSVLEGVRLSRFDSREVYAWLGIPFAKAPVGDLRFRAPRSIKLKSGRFRAQSFSERCTQISTRYDQLLDAIKPGQVIGSEDCLYLNVFVPKSALMSKKKLPVMFWIHGGGIRGGMPVKRCIYQIIF